MLLTCWPMLITFTSPKGAEMSSQQGTGWAVITGASSGFGEIFADLLAKRGMSLLLTGRDETRLNAVAQRVRQIAGVDVDLVIGDLGTEAGVDTLAARLDGRTGEGLVKNAGFGPDARF